MIIFEIVKFITTGENERTFRKHYAISVENHIPKRETLYLAFEIFKKQRIESSEVSVQKSHFSKFHFWCKLGVCACPLQANFSTACF